MLQDRLAGIVSNTMVKHPNIGDEVHKILQAGPVNLQRQSTCNLSACRRTSSRARKLESLSLRRLCFCGLWHGWGFSGSYGSCRTCLGLTMFGRGNACLQRSWCEWVHPNLSRKPQTSTPEPPRSSSIQGRLRREHEKLAEELQQASRGLHVRLQDNRPFSHTCDPPHCAVRNCTSTRKTTHLDTQDREDCALLSRSVTELQSISRAGARLL